MRMGRWRWPLAALLILLVAPPIAWPSAGRFTRAAGWPSGSDLSRWANLALTSLSLAGGVIALSLPIGLLLAIALFKSDTPGRAAMRRILLLGLFVPLPIFAAAWQTLLSNVLGAMTTSPGRPWPSGLPAAIIIHSVAAVPWVVWIVGQGLRWVEPELEDDALLAASPWTVFWRVTLPRCRLALGVAMVWILVQTLTEITVTDMVLVRTFAEEVYTQIVLPEPVDAQLSAESAVTRAAVAAIPPMLGLTVGLMLALRAIERRIPRVQTSASARPLIELGRWRWPVAAAVAVVVIGLTATPMGALIDRVGQAGAPPMWSLAAAADVMLLTLRAHGPLIVASLALAAGIGVAAGILGILAAWLARDSSRFRALVFVLAAICWAAPGPIIGLGLTQVIQSLLDAEEAVGGHWLHWALYAGPSPAPVFWAELVRLWPFALAIVWPAVHAVPQSLVDASRVDGARPREEFQLVILPAVWPELAAAALAVAVLALGELSASKIVATAGGETFAHAVFAQLHYGVTPTVAAQCLILLAFVFPIVWLPGPRWWRGNR